MKPKIMSAKHRACRERRVLTLQRVGWRQLNGNGTWINPRSKRPVDLDTALLIEDLRGTFQHEFQRAHYLAHPRIRLPRKKKQP